MDLRKARNARFQWEVQKACERLIIQYTHFIDFGQAERVAELFAPDGTWEAYRNRKVGQHEIREAFRLRQNNTRRVSRHVCTNMSIDVTGSEQATGITYFTLFREEWGAGLDFVPFEGPKMVGDYTDRFVLTPDGWRFAHRKVSVVFKVPATPLLSESAGTDSAPRELSESEIAFRANGSITDEES